MSADELLHRLVGVPLHTITRRERNVILRVESDCVIVATRRAPAGEPVPVMSVQRALDKLMADGEVRVDVPTLGHRSSFIGAVLRTLPDVETLTRPQRVRRRAE
jgi:hypothetical protein